MTEAKNKVGRPSSYRPEYAAMMDEYFDIEAFTQHDVENSKGQVQSVITPAAFPTFAGFATKIGVHQETLINWSNALDDEGNRKHPEFFEAYKRAKDHQERILAQNGLAGVYQGNFAIFTAKNVIGWRDKQEHEVTGADGGPLKVTVTVVDPAGDESA